MSRKILLFGGSWYAVPVECVSTDGGDHFRKIGKGPVLSYSYDEPFIIGSPQIRKFGGTFYMTLW